MVRGDVTQAARRPAALGWNFLLRSPEQWEDNKMKSQRASACAGALLAGILVVTGPAAAQNVTFKEVAPDLHFLFDFTSSNAVVLTTNDGVLVIDTRQHPRDGEDLLARIRKITDKPIKWVINSHFHGDHHFGNPPFKSGRSDLRRAERDRAHHGAGAAEGVGPARQFLQEPGLRSG